MAKPNPFFDVDMSKFADVSKLMSEFKLPGVDVELSSPPSRRTFRH